MDKFSPLFGDLEGRLGANIRSNLFGRDDKSYKKLAQLDDPYAFLEKPYQDLAKSEAEDLNPDVSEKLFRTTFAEQIGLDLDEDSQLLLNDSKNTLNRLFSNFDQPGLDSGFIQEELYGFSRLAFRDKNDVGLDQLGHRYATADMAIDRLTKRDLINTSSTYSYLQQEISLSEHERNTKSFYSSIPSSLDQIDDYSLSRAKKLLDDVDYVNRPGIMPMVSLIGGAESELTIDVYQFNNKVIRAAVAAKLFEAQSSGQTFNLTVRLASPVSNDTFENVGLTYKSILGPNLLAYRELEMLKQHFQRENSTVNVDVKWADKFSHTKFFMNQDTAIIGSMNLQQPLGGSLFQAGSNFETIRVLHNRLNDVQRADYLNSKDSISDIQNFISRNKNLDSSTLLYLQARQVMLRSMGDDRLSVSTENRNIAGPKEIYDQLRASLDRVGKGNTKMLMVLNQVFLLEGDKADPFDFGEMGKDSLGETERWKSNLTRKKENYRKDIQTRVLDLINQGHITAIVDPRNYRENVQKVVFDKLQGAGVLESVDYSLSALVTKFNKNESALARHLKDAGITGADYLAKQVLMVTGGNVVVGQAPQIHNKSYIVYESQGTGLDLLGMSVDEFNAKVKYQSGYIRPVASNVANSSNFNFRSMSDGSGDQDSTNSELGVSFVDPSKFKGLAASNLDEDTEREELRKDVINFHTLATNLYRPRASQIIYENDSSFAYEKMVDTKKVNKLFEDLTDIAKRTGYNPETGKGGAFQVMQQFSGGDAINVMVTIGEGRTQKKLRLTALQSGPGDRGNYLSVDQGFVFQGLTVLNRTEQAAPLGFDREGGKLTVGKDKRVVLTPHETTLAYVSTLALEQSQVRYVKEPFGYFKQNYGGTVGDANTTNDRLRTGGYKFLSSILQVPDLNVNSLLGGSLRDTEIKKRFEANLFSRLLDKNDSELSIVRNLAGITDAQFESRKTDLQELMRPLLGFVSNTNPAERGYLLGFDRDNPLGSASHPTVIGEIIKKIDSNPQKFADLMYMFVKSQDDAIYENSVNVRITEVSKRAGEAFNTPTQEAINNAYKYATPLMMIKSGNIIKALQRSALTNQGFNTLAGYSVLSYGGTAGPTDYLGESMDDSGVFTKATDGSSSISRPRDKVFIDAFPEVLEFVEEGKITNLYSTDMIGSTGMGAVINESEVENYLKTVPVHMQAAVRASLSTGGVLNTKGSSWLNLNIDAKKIAQTSGRLKNAIGSRPMEEINAIYGALAELHKGDLAESYVADYIKNLRSEITKAGGKNTNLIHRGFEYGAMFGTPFNDENKFIKNTFVTSGIISSEASELVDFFKDEVERTFGVTYDTSIGKELLRGRLLQTKLHGMSHDALGVHKPSVAFFALGGGFSDYGYTNADFGTKLTDKVLRKVRGAAFTELEKAKDSNAPTRYGWLDRATKSLKGSLTKADLQGIAFSMFDNVQLAPGKTYSVGYEDANDQFVLYDEQGKSKQIITNAATLELITGGIESANRNPTVGSVMANTNVPANRGANAIEIIKSTILPGSEVTNEISVQLEFLRTILEEGGRRVESMSGGLFKAPVNVLSREVFEDLLGQAQTAGMGDFFNTQYEVENIRGMFSFKHFKTASLEHGAEVLRRGDFQKVVNETTDYRLAASVLLSTHLENFGGSGDDVLKSRVLERLGTLALSGQLGDNFKEKAFKFALDEGKSFTNESLGKTLTITGGSRNEYLTPILQGIQLGDVLSALEGRGNFKNQFLEVTQGRFGKRDYLTNNIGDRELAHLAGWTHIGLQVMSLQERMNFVTISLDSVITRGIQKNYNGVRDVAESGYISLGIDAGYTETELFDPEMAPIIAQSLKDKMNTFPFIALYTSLNPSQTKGPNSSKKTAQTEFQHLLGDPFSTNSREFINKTSGVRKVFADVMTLISRTKVSSTDVEANMMNLGKLDDHFYSPQFRGAMANFYANPLIPDKNMDRVREKFKLVSILLDIDGTNNQIAALSLIDAAKANNWKFEEKDGSGSKHKPFLDRLKGIIQSGDGDQLRAQYQTEDLNLRLTSASYRLNPNKQLAVDYAEAVTSSLLDTAYANKNLGLSIPKIFVTGETVHVSKEDSINTIMLSPQAMKQVGEQFGGYVSDVLKRQIVLWEAMTEGSVVRDFYTMVASNPDKTEFRDINPEVLAKVREFQNFSIEHLNLIEQELSGRLAQEVFGNKVRVKGGTVVPTASWFVGLREGVISEVTTSKIGGKAKGDRVEMLDVLTNFSRSRLISSINSLGLDKYNELPESLITKQIVTLQKGFSQQGTGLVSQIMHFSRGIQDDLAAGADPSNLIGRVNEEFKRYKDFSLNKEDGDAFSIRLVLSELKALRGTLDKKLGINSDAAKLVTTFKELPIFIEGLMVGSTGRAKYGINPIVSTINDVDRLTSAIVRNASDTDRLKTNSALDKDLSIEQSTNLLKLQVSNLKKVYSEAVTTLAEFTASGKSSNFGLNDNTIRDLSSRIQGYTRDLNAIAGIADKDTKLDRLRELKIMIDVEVSLRTTQWNMAYAQVWRSAPLGSLELNRNVVSLRMLHSVNESIKAASGLDNFYAPERNKTLSMFHPISFLATNLGDFDGDTISVITSSRADLISKKEALQSYMDTMSPGDPAVTAKFQPQLDALNAQIGEIDRGASYKSFVQSTKTWVANYLKVDESMFKDSSPEALLSMAQHSMGGLFFGVNKARSRTLHLEGLVKHAGKSTFSAELSSQFPDIPASLRTQLEQEGAKGEKLFAQYIDRLDASSEMFTHLGSMIKNSEGVLMTPDHLEMMNRAVGQAGNVVLGKVYNSTTALMYGQAPVLALAHAITNDASFRALIENQGFDSQKLLSMATAQRDSIARMGGLKQELEQMMRDSIKLKSNAEDFKNEIAKLSEDYKAAAKAGNFETQQSIIKGMADLTGSSALQNFDDYITNYADLNTPHVRNQDDPIFAKQANLLSSFGIDDSLLSSIRTHIGDPESGLALATGFKVKQDLINTATQFAFEKNLALYGEGALTGSSTELGDSLKNLDPGVRAQVTALMPAYDKSYSLSDGSLLSEFGYFLGSKETFKRGAGGEFLGSEEAKQLLALQFLKSRDSVNMFTGERGEMLGDYVQSDVIRKSSYNGKLVNFAEGSAGYQMAVQAMTQGKITNPDVTLDFVNMVTLGLGFTADEESILEASDPVNKEGLKKRFLFKKLFDMQDDLTGGGGHTFLQQMSKIFEADTEGKVASAFYSIIETTGFGQQASSIMAILRADQTQGFGSELTNYMNKIGLDDSTKEQIRAMSRADVEGQLSSIGVASQYHGELEKVFKKTYDSEGALHKHLERLGMQDELQRDSIIKLSNARTFKGSDSEYDQFLRKVTSGYVNQKAGVAPETQNVGIASKVLRNLGAKTNDLAQVGLFPLLGLLGSAVSTGSVSDEQVQQSLGNAMIAMSFAGQGSNRTGFSRSYGALSGMGFKYRMAVAQDPEDPLGAIARSTIQEFAFMAASQFLMPKATDLAAKLMGKQAHSLDIDTLQGVRSGASTVLGAALSWAGATVISRVTKGVVVDMARFSASIATKSYAQELVETIINAASKGFVNAQVEEAPDEIDAPLQSESGELVQYSVETVFGSEAEGANVSLYADLFENSNDYTIAQTVGGRSSNDQMGYISEGGMA